MSLIEDAATIAAPEIGLPLKIWGWLRGHWGMLAIGAGVLAAGILAAVLVVDHFAGAKVKAAQAKLDANVASATQTSAADAVTTIERDITHENTIERTVEHAQDAVDAAPDAAAADAAGRAGLCAVAANFCPATSVQQPDPR